MVTLIRSVCIPQRNLNQNLSWPATEPAIQSGGSAMSTVGSLDGRVKPGHDVGVERPSTEYWFKPESSGQGHLPVHWKGAAAIALFALALIVIPSAVALVVGDDAAGACFAAFCAGTLTWFWLAFARAKTDRAEVSDYSYFLPIPFDLFR